MLRMLYGQKVLVVVYHVVMNNCVTFPIKGIYWNHEGSAQVFEGERARDLRWHQAYRFSKYERLLQASILKASYLYDYLAMISLDGFLHQHFQ